MAKRLFERAHLIDGERLRIDHDYRVARRRLR